MIKPNKTQTKIEKRMIIRSGIIVLIFWGQRWRCGQNRRGLSALSRSVAMVTKKKIHLERMEASEEGKSDRADEIKKKEKKM